MAEKTKEQKLVKEMQDLLVEVSDINCEDINDSNYRKFYEEAADQLNLFEEDEDGESDIYKFTYELLDDYVTLRNKLCKVLEEQGMDFEQRKQFFKLNLC